MVLTLENLNEPIPQPEPDHLLRLAEADKQRMLKAFGEGRYNDENSPWKTINEPGLETAALSGVLDIDKENATKIIGQLQSHGFFLRFTGPIAGVALQTFTGSCTFYRQQEIDKYPCTLTLARPHKTTDGQHIHNEEDRDVYCQVEIVNPKSDNAKTSELYRVDGHCPIEILPELIKAVDYSVGAKETPEEADKVFTGEDVTDGVVYGEPLRDRIWQHQPFHDHYLKIGESRNAATASDKSRPNDVDVPTKKKRGFLTSIASLFGQSS